MEDFLKTFDVRNITDDKQLKVQVGKMRQLLKGTNPELLRTDESNRDFIREKFEEIKKNMAPLIVEKPTRSISFDEE